VGDHDGEKRGAKFTTLFDDVAAECAAQCGSSPFVQSFANAVGDLIGFWGQRLAVSARLANSYQYLFGVVCKLGYNFGWRCWPKQSSPVRLSGSSAELCSLYSRSYLDAFFRQREVRSSD
jgi:hypothetical protein